MPISWRPNYTQNTTIVFTQNCFTTLVTGCVWVGVLDAPIKTINNEVHYQVWKKTCVLDTQAKKLAYLPR